jgi:multidrug efflux pump subunit AcrA (membrane-fusion protein)
VRGTAVLLPNNSRPVYAATAGELMFCLAAGDRVAQGDVVARLTSDELELERLQLEGEAEVARVQCRQLRTIRTWSDEALRELPAAEAALANAEAQLAEFSERIATLTLTAPTAGVVIAVPDRQGRHNAFRLAGWDGSLLEAQNRGAWVEPGDVLCTIGDPDRCEALVAVEERDVAQLAAGQPVRLLLDALPTRVLVGEIVDVARRGNERPAEQSTIAPGKYHLVKVKLTEVKLPSLVGARGTAKIAARQSTLAKLAIDKIAQLVRLPW